MVETSCNAADSDREVIEIERVGNFQGVRAGYVPVG